MVFQHLVEDGEPAGPRRGRRGQLLAMARWRAGCAGLGGQPQGDGIAAGGGVCQPGGHRVRDDQAEVAREDAAPGVGVDDQPPRRRQGVERVGDQMAEGVDVGGAGADHVVAGACRGHRVSRVGVLGGDSVRAEPDRGVDGRAAGLEDQGPAQPGYRDGGVAGRKGPGGRERVMLDGEHGDGGQRDGGQGGCGQAAPGILAAGVAGEERDDRGGGGREQQNDAQPPPVVPSQKNSRAIGLCPVSAYSAMTASPGTLWASDAALGMLLPPVRPSAAGSTFSRPRAKAYRQTALWNASAAANSEVTNSTWAAWPSAALPDRPNSSLGP